MVAISNFFLDQRPKANIKLITPRTATEIHSLLLNIARYVSADTLTQSSALGYLPFSLKGMLSSKNGGILSLADITN